MFSIGKPSKTYALISIIKDNILFEQEIFWFWIYVNFINRIFLSIFIGRILFDVHLLRVGLRRQQQKVFALQS